MKIKRVSDTSAMKLTEEILRIREEFLLPCPACPADSLVELIPAGLSTLNSWRSLTEEVHPCLMPVHIDDHHINRNVECLEMICKIKEFIVGVLPITAPPISESILWRKRNPTCNLCKICQGSHIVMTISKHIKVLSVLVIAALHPIFPVAVYRNEEMTLTLIHYSPSVTRKNTLVIRLQSLLSITFIQGSCCTEKVA